MSVKSPAAVLVDAQRNLISATNPLATHDESTQDTLETIVQQLDQPLDVNLPPGSATAVKQDAAQTTLASLDAKSPALSGGKVPTTTVVTSMPAVTVTSMPAVTGSVSVTSMPAITGSVVVSNLPSTQAVTLDTSTTALRVQVTNPTSTVAVSSVPLATNASSESTLATRASEATLAARASETTLAAMSAKLGAGQKLAASSTSVVLASDSPALPITGSVTTTPSGVQQISAAALPLPAGSATSAKQDSIISALGGTILTDGSAHVQPVSLSNTSASSVHVTLDNPTSTVAISGVPHVVIDNPTTTVSVGNIPHVVVDNQPTSINIGNLPTTQQVSFASTPTVNLSHGTSGDPLYVNVVNSGGGGGTASDVHITNTSLAVDASGHALTIDSSTPIAVTGNVNASVTFPNVQAISASALPLPSGAASESTLSALSGKVAAGPAVKAASTSVTIATDQGAIPISGTVTSTPSGTQTIAGSVSVTGTVSTRALTASDVVTIVPSGTTSISASSLPLPSGAASETSLASLRSDVTGGSQISQLRSGAKGSSTAALVTSTAVDANHQGLDVVVQGTVPISSASTLNVSVQNASIPITAASALAVTVGSSITSLPSVTVGSSALPTGASTESTLSALSAKFGTIGQKNKAGSTSVVLASDSDTLPVSVQGTPAVTLSGTSNAVNASITNASLAVTVGSSITALPSVTVGSSVLPTGASSETTLAAISAKLPASLGAKTSAGSLSVTLPTDQAALATTLASTTITSSALPTGASTESTLAGLSAKLPASLGGKTSAASLSIAPATDASFPVTSSTLATQATLASILANTPSVGAKTSAASAPVVLATDQASIPVAATLQNSSIAVTSSTFATDTVLQAVRDRLPTSLGAKTSAASLSVTPASDAVYNTRALSNASDSINVSGTVSAAQSGAWYTRLADSTGSNIAAVSAAGALTVQGTVTASNPSVSATAAAVPAQATLAGGTDGTNIRALSVSSSGVLSVSLASVPSHPVTLTSTTLTGTSAISSTQLPASLGAKTTANALAVSLASDQAAVPVTLSSTTLTGTSAVSSTQLPTSLGAKTTAASLAVALPTDQAAIPVTLTSTTLTGTSAVSSAQLPASLGAKTTANALAVSLASDQAAIPVTLTSTTLTGTSAVSSTQLPGALVSGGLNIRPLNSSDVVTATNPSVGATAAAVPASATLAAGSDGTNTRALSVSSAGVLQTAITNTPAVTLASTTITSSTLPTGASTETTLASRLADSTFTGRVNTLGQKTMANSTPITIASDQSRLLAALVDSGNGTGATIKGSGAAAVSGDGALVTTISPNSASLAVTSSTLATQTTLASVLTSVQSLDTKQPSVGAKTSAASSPVVLASDQAAIPVTLTSTTLTGTSAVSSTQLPAALVSGGLNIRPLTSSDVVTATNPSVGATAAAVPASATLAAGSDGTNTRALSVSSAGVLRVDPSGTTTQPVSIAGSVTTTLASTTISSGSIAISNTPAVTLASTTVTNTVATSSTQLPVSLGQKASAASLAVVLPSDQQVNVRALSSGTDSIAVSGTVSSTQSGTWTTQIGSSGLGGTAANSIWARFGDPVNQVAAAVKSTTPGSGDNALAVLIQPNSAVLGVSSTTLATNAVLIGGTQVTRVSDGTTTAKVAPASTAPALTDPALIVALRGDSSVALTRGAVAETPLYVATASSQSVSNSIANQLYVQGTDGSNLTPAGDAAARAIFVQASNLSIRNLTSTDQITIANSSLPATQSGTWSNRLTDGTNTAAVKAASTAAALTDPALVVTLSNTSAPRHRDLHELDCKHNERNDPRSERKSQRLHALEQQHGRSVPTLRRSHRDCSDSECDDSSRRILRVPWLDELDVHRRRVGDLERGKRPGADHGVKLMPLYSLSNPIDQEQGFIKSVLPSSVTAHTVTAGTAFFVYLCRTNAPLIPAAVQMLVINTPATTTNPTYFGLFTSAAAPNGTAQSLTCVEAQSLALATMNAAGPSLRTVSPYTIGWQGGVHAWLGVVVPTASTAPTCVSIGADALRGAILTRASTSSFVTNTSYPGTSLAAYNGTAPDIWIKL